MDELPLVNCRALRNDYLECLHHRKEVCSDINDDEMYDQNMTN